MWAAAEGHSDTAELLLSHGADANARDRVSRDEGVGVWVRVYVLFYKY